ncbi:SsgA family sporulation/cell division regulator, partial [Streptomyces cavourensis]
EGLAELLAPLPADDLWLSDPWSADEPSSQDGEA